MVAADIASQPKKREYNMPRGRAPKSPLDKLKAKIGSEELVIEIEGYDAEQLSARIALCEANIAVSENARDADDDLARMIDEVKEAKGPYTDVIKAQRAVQRFCHLMRAAKGLT